MFENTGLFQVDDADSVRPVVLYPLIRGQQALLGETAIFDMHNDRGMMDRITYLWVSLILSFGYVAGTYPTCFLAQSYSTRIVINITLLRFGGCVGYACMQDIRPVPRQTLLPWPD